MRRNSGVHNESSQIPSLPPDRNVLARYHPCGKSNDYLTRFLLQETGQGQDSELRCNLFFLKKYLYSTIMIVDW
jgi:hypothetical protein